MNKVLYLFNIRQHCKNRIREREGHILYFLLAKVVGEKYSYKESKCGKCLEWRYKHHVFLTQNGKLQTYINKLR